MLLLVCLCILCCSAAIEALSPGGAVLIVGSINADIVIPLQRVDRFPDAGETMVVNDEDKYVDDATTNDDDRKATDIESGRVIPGGKGANQAVSCSRLGAQSVFMCRFGDDSNAALLEKTMADNGVDVSFASRVDKPSGLGLVFMRKGGAVSAVVIGGSNSAWLDADSLMRDVKRALEEVNHIKCIMLQMEVPQYVNEIVAQAAHEAGIPVFQDVGGADNELTRAHLQKCTFLSPNLSELKRLTKLDTGSDEDILKAAKSLQARGARNVLVTLGSEGSLLLAEDGTTVLRQPCVSVGCVVDETGAGDNYRAAFVVAHFVDALPLQDSMLFASVAGALAVTKMGAIPACSSRDECNGVLDKLSSNVLGLKGGRSQHSQWTLRGGSAVSDAATSTDDSPFPFKFASRLNSMRDRLDLCLPGEDDSVYGWIARQGRIAGLDLVDFNYPQHITSPVVTAELLSGLMQALREAGLNCGAICLRYPKNMRAGAFTNPDRSLRSSAIQLTKEACDWAVALGANEVVVWSAFDGYDYALQADYDQLWDDVVTAFQEICDLYPGVKISLEYKPTDENTRFFAIPSTGSAQQLMAEVDRANFGLTLDFGHCLMAGENPAQSVAYVNRRGGKLFGVQLGDGYGRLGATLSSLYGTCCDDDLLKCRCRGWIGLREHSCQGFVGVCLLVDPD